MHDTIQMQIIIHPRSIGDKVIRHKEVYDGERQSWTTGEVQVALQKPKKAPTTTTWGRAEEAFEKRGTVFQSRVRKSVGAYIKFGNHLVQIENVKRNGEIYYQVATNYSYSYPDLLPRAESRISDRNDKRSNKGYKSVMTDRVLKWKIQAGAEIVSFFISNEHS